MAMKSGHWKKKET